MRILYVDVDSLRPDHLGCYGYERPTSPVIDGLAEDGIHFGSYFASDSPCVPSRAACFSGRPGIRNGVVAHEDTPSGCALRYGNRERNGVAPLLPYHLARAGYTTVSFSSFADRHLAGWFHLGFRQFFTSSLKRGNENADEVNAVALPWFRRHAAEPDWFVHLNYWDPHTNYTEPIEYMERMAAYPAPSWPDEETIAAQQVLTGVRTPRTLWGASARGAEDTSPVPTMPDRIGNRADFAHLMDGYDGAIRYADEHLGHVLDELHRQGVLEETAIVVSADHGEAFGELGQYMEHGTASPAVTRLPFVVNWPGITDAVAGSANGDLLTNVDFAPTVAEALGLSVPEGWSGQSFLPLLRGEPFPHRRAEIVWTHGLHTRQRAVFGGRYLYIRTYHPSVYHYPPRMLFDLEADPCQTVDLAETEPGEVERLDGVLLAWELEQVRATGQSDPLRDVQPHQPSMLAAFDDYLDRLRAAGRDADADRLLRRVERLVEDYAPGALTD